MPQSRSLENRLLVVVFALAVLSTLGAASPAVPHLKLDRSSPASGADLTEAPAEIRLFFSEAPEVAVSRIALSWAEGEIDLGEIEAGPENSIAAKIQEQLVPGSYTVAWRTSSGDGHPIRGTFDFRVMATRPRNDARF